MPAPESLPDDLKELAFRNSFELSHSRWRSDVRELAHRLGLDDANDEARAKGAPALAAAPSRAAAWVTRRRALGAAAAAVAAAGLGVAAPFVRRRLMGQSGPSLRSITFDTVTVDQKGRPLPSEKAAASLFTEALPAGAGLDMVAIPGGTFLMGSPVYQLERRANEGPRHEVTLRPFFIGASPITQAQWAAVATGRAAKTSRALRPVPSFFKGDRLPVESVTWNEADEFCRRLSEIAGRKYRLPSEAEWEYACRAGTTSAFNVGPTITTDLANYCGTGGAVCGDSNGKSIASDVYDGVTYTSGAYAQGPTGTFRGTTTPAGTFPPNRFGLYDMHGNVWEYCLDRASDNYAGAPTDGSPNLSGPADGERVLRGGSWSHNPAICRSAYRDFLAPDNSGWQGRIGLRVVCAH